MPEENGESEVFNGEKYLVFTILGKFYTFPSRIISEVTAFDTVYPLPLVPEYVMGIINRYSAPYALVDIGLLIQKVPTPQSKVVVLKETVEKIAFLIDDVVDIVDVAQSDLLKIEQGTETNDSTDIIESSFGWHETNVFVLNIRQIISRVVSEFRV
ncbi:chemotaxis protein CheW [Treponema primitia]|uniref:chemotaxis protein CheW n=1 Tax=Treponema primitia TaxID=88058 RepID=UPI00025557FB|nr:chemotaxis protein CheW [Treponema primitia]